MRAALREQFDRKFVAIGRQSRTFTQGYYLFTRKDGADLTDDDLELLSGVVFGQANGFSLDNPKTGRVTFTCDSSG